MATIYKRKNKNRSYSYRVQIRRKGVRIFCYTFKSAEDACDWVEKNEKRYIDDPDYYHSWAEKNRLKHQRDRLFDA